MVLAKVGAAAGEEESRLSFVGGSDASVLKQEGGKVEQNLGGFTKLDNLIY
jgi:hypothetical protein